MFESYRRKKQKREWAQARTRATAAMFAGEGFYNTNPWSFVFGIAVAILASMFTLDWLLRDPKPDDARPRQAPAALPSDEIAVELE